ncbi:MAG: M28 family metallopeptidase [Treponema sp.]|nr:M28 family metallopeptidase [Treponema sp.]
MKQTENTDWNKSSPYDRFSYFIASKIDRYKALLTTIEKLELNSLVVSIADHKHIFIFPPGKKMPGIKGSTFPFAGESPYIFVAHYDRVPGSPGANDNSIAVFHLLNVALKFIKQGVSNWIILFTDKEEIKDGESFEKQGSFALAQKLKSWGLEKARIYNFDACGTGDTFVISTITDLILGNNDNPNILKLKDAIRLLSNHVLETTYNLRFDKVLLAPIPFCDDIGFLRAGFAAQTITMLPSAEAAQYEEILRKYPEFPKLMISGEIKTSPERRHLPITWRNLNTPADTPDRLTPQFFEKICNLVENLCR